MPQMWGIGKLLPHIWRNQGPNYNMAFEVRQANEAIWNLKELPGRRRAISRLPACSQSRFYLINAGAGSRPGLTTSALTQECRDLQIVDPECRSLGRCRPRWWWGFRLPLYRN